MNFNNFEFNLGRKKLVVTPVIIDDPVLDLDHDGKPDSLLFEGDIFGTHVVVTEDDDSYNIDVDGDGDADYIIDK